MIGRTLANKISEIPLLMGELSREWNNRPYWDDVFSASKLCRLEKFDVDFKEVGDQYILTADLPGISKEEVDITVENDVLTMSYERQKSKEEKGENFHLQERKVGKFSRSFNLPTIDDKSIAASLKDGILTVTMNKVPEAQTKHIEVKVD